MIAGAGAAVEGVSLTILVSVTARSLEFSSCLREDNASVAIADADDVTVDTTEVEVFCLTISISWLAGNDTFSFSPIESIIEKKIIYNQK